ncbi:hypothetical protein ZYGR_0S02300 [Zygosaccharomyces rouxii]|uniref:Anaphase-promoting complex subunit 5 n=2 Tax=Zygosaccharomyces rouxii TaxID=4956 RepID=C5DXT5_ZYGRC|nr:uncharacterized protein ZYRO0F07656g [Zygosaccharomyces rouxii]KAH9199355.1 anaphase-promoting complex subunit 5-domain-containing protein [Zygosaccharomyces rouxii]GAV50096.1 hypothetical protein ZYGR_0S02300 [Zygosaccharomyces rouxii]CAR28596.1 ZYRO0F07656p [Zygosaccharomyces rouxii]
MSMSKLKLISSEIECNQRKTMGAESQFKITTSLTPYDVSTLVLIYLYCCHNVKVPMNIFVKLITPTIPSTEINPILEIEKLDLTVDRPLSVHLETLVSYVLHSGQRQLVIQLLSVLNSLDSLDTLTQLLSFLEKECLVKTYRTKKPSSSQGCRSITKTSYLGVYLDKCLIEYHLGSFDDREELWESFMQYLQSFKSTDLWKRLECELKPFEFEFRPTINDDDDDDSDREMIAWFQSFGKKITSVDKPVILIGERYLRSLLNWELVTVCKTRTKIDPGTRQILAGLSLNDLTHFPAAHVLAYLEAVFDNSYQEAADALHNYFDYMLTQNDENCFHISLLCLATFHTCMHDGPAAIKAFEEATKVARENKNTGTLNLIMIWVVNFIEIYPEYSSQFQVTVEQIVRYLKFCPDNENSLIFEKAYKFESLLLMMDNADTTLVLESFFKYMAIAIQRLQFGSDFTQVCKYGTKLWETLGQPLLSEVYGAYMKERIQGDEGDQEIHDAFKSLESGDHLTVNKILLKLRSPRLTDDHLKKLKLLEIKYLISTGDYEQAMQRVSESMRDLDTNVMNAEWKFKFQVENCHILLSCGMAVRCLPILKDMLDASMQSKNVLRASESIVLLCATLKQLGKDEESRFLLENNLHVILQYRHLETRAIGLLK